MRRRGISLIEVAFVALLLCLLSGIIGPQLGRSPFNAKRNQTTFRLQTIRTAVEKFRAVHGEPPGNLIALTEAVVQNEAALLTEAQAPQVSRLLTAIPTEALTGSARVLVVEQPGRLQIPAHSASGGWIYNATTGEVRVNHPDYGEF